MLSFIGIVAIVVLAVLAWRSGATEPNSEVLDIPHKTVERIGRLWDITHQSIREKRFIKAEKALLSILKIDEKNAAAYNRLGILYAKQREYKDAIDCFEIASSIEVTPSSLHNLGLIYFETENYEKASIAFEKALKLESGVAARHIAYAKVIEKLGNTKLVVTELEKAVELEPSQEAFLLLLKAYKAAGRVEAATRLEHKIRMITSGAARGPKKRILRPRRVVV